MLKLIVLCLALAPLPSPILARAAGDPAAGKQAFEICGSCHQLGRNSLGPNLVGVVGRRSASYPEYDYSWALRNSHLVWRAANLREWIRRPSAKVHGTKMLSPGNEDERKIGDLISYLETLK